MIFSPLHFLAMKWEPWPLDRAPFACLRSPIPMNDLLESIRTSTEHGAPEARIKSIVRRELALYPCGPSQSETRSPSRSTE